MDRGNERTIVMITTETPEPGSAGAEDAGRVADGAEVGNAVVSIGDARDGEAGEELVQVQDDDIPWEVSGVNFVL